MTSKTKASSIDSHVDISAPFTVGQYILVAGVDIKNDGSVRRLTASEIAAFNAHRPAVDR